jgi:hypothetical protein
MKIFNTLYFFISVNYIQKFEYTSGASRCVTDNCICSVVDNSTKYYPNNIYSNRLSLFYKEDDDSLSNDNKKLLNNFLFNFDKNKYNISIIGYGDGCGSSEYNIELSKRRANAISKYVYKWDSFPIIRYYGKETEKHNPESRRVDIVIHSKGNLAEKIENISADFYLLDASGSMDIDNWKQIISASKKPGSQVWVSKMFGCYNGQRLSSIKPEGGTEVWYAYWSILDKMSFGQSLLIISDFNANYPLTSLESARLSEKARKKGVKVYFIKL